MRIKGIRRFAVHKKRKVREHGLIGITSEIVNNNGEEVGL